MRAGFPLITKTEVEAIFREVDADESGFIEAAEFKAFAKSHPIYVQIFMDWQERNPPKGTPRAAESESEYDTPTGGDGGGGL